MSSVEPVRTEGDKNAVLEVDRALHANAEHWLAKEILLLQAQVLRRMDLTSKSFFTLIEKGSCFAGSLFELALASDRIVNIFQRCGGVDLPIIRLALLR